MCRDATEAEHRKELESPVVAMMVWSVVLDTGDQWLMTDDDDDDDDDGSVFYSIGLRHIVIIIIMMQAQWRESSTFGITRYIPSGKLT